MTRRGRSLCAALAAALSGCCDEHFCTSQDVAALVVDLAGSDVVDCGSWSEEREAALRACMEDALADDRPARYTRAGSPAAFTIVHEPEAKTFVIRFLPQESVEWSECKDPIMVDGLPDCETYVPALQDLMLACQHSDSCNAIADSEH